MSGIAWLCTVSRLVSDLVFDLTQKPMLPLRFGLIPQAHRDHDPVENHLSRARSECTDQVFRLTVRAGFLHSHVPLK
ncbi:MAG: hypothetical protein EOP94_00850 [Zymomonas sp.]|nr:MAG: hypothetical protein EOP94_00850 [Zymomonas sp.]